MSAYPGRIIRQFWFFSLVADWTIWGWMDAIDDLLDLKRVPERNRFR